MNIDRHERTCSGKRGEGGAEGVVALREPGSPRGVLGRQDLKKRPPLPQKAGEGARGRVTGSLPQRSNASHAHAKALFFVFFFFSFYFLFSIFHM